MGRKPIVGGNWKCNPVDPAVLPDLVANINACNTDDCDVYVAMARRSVVMTTSAAMAVESEEILRLALVRSLCRSEGP